MPSKMRSPLLGYNHNLKYKGRVYHVQTEDSGVRQPHVFTHLFYDGTILATKKTDYAHLLDVADSDRLVRGIMQQQHKDMMKELLRGVHDEAIRRLFGAVDAREVSAEMPVGDAAANPAQAGSAVRRVPGGAAEASPPVLGTDGSTVLSSDVSSRPAAAHHVPETAAPGRGAAAAKDPSTRPSSASTPQPSRAPGGGEPKGSSVVMVAPVVVVTDIGASPRRQNRSQTVPRLPVMEADRSAQAPSASRLSEGRREDRRTAVDAQFRPEESRSIPPTVFAEGVVEDEEGLDEVILQYLAEDLPDE